jgi:DNA helicase-2/ATP-dependent DNA helicase PcrA
MEQSYSSSDIFALTFTKKAGHELQARLSKLARGVWCGTLHSLCLDICQREEGRINVISETESDMLLEDCGRSLGMVDIVSGKWHEKHLDFWKKVVSDHRCGSECRTAKGKQLTSLYESKLKLGGDCDYTGLLLRAYKHIQNGHLSNIRHLFVDEAQDIDPFQWKMIETIIEKGNKCKVTYVGDPRQSIYSFRGANPDYLLQKEGTVLYLQDNYRSPQCVVEASNRLISRNPEGNVPMRYTLSQGSLTLEKTTADECVRWSLDNFYSPEDIAVLCRTNREVQTIANILANQNVPVYCPTPPAPACPVNAILAFGTRQHSPAAWALFNRTLRPFIEVPKEPDHAALRMQAHYCERTKACGNAVTQASMPYAVVGDILPLVREWFDVSFWERFAGYPIHKALSERNLMEDTEDGQGNRVAVMTIHQSKGLEWPVVIVSGMVEGNLPIQSAVKNYKATEEERRLCYVAWTRAREKLCLLYDESRPLSRFVNEGVAHEQIDNRRGLLDFINSPF